MNVDEITIIILVNQQNEAIGIDNDSGGYPYLPSYFGGVRFFSSTQAACDYADIWDRPANRETARVNYGAPFKVKQISISGVRLHQTEMSN